MKTLLFKILYVLAIICFIIAIGVGAVALAIMITAP